ncbi:sensor histidine kinase [Flavobacterium sp. SLB02]|nr:sensor histidine kinase [Flavobacterium sp. SLB02]
MSSFYIFNQKKIKKVYLFFLILLTTNIQAQNISLIEKMASQGYAKRFDDTIACLKIQKQALALAIKNKSKEDQVICYSYLALTQRRLINLKAYIHYADRAYYLSKKVNKTRVKAHAALAMGSLKSYIEDQPEALNYLLEAYRLFTKVKAHDQCARIASDISYLFSPESPSKVEKYAREAIEHARKSGDAESELYARLAFGSYLIDKMETGTQTDWRNAVAFFEQTVWIAQRNADKIDSKSNMGIAYINLADLYTKGPKPLNEKSFLENLEKATLIAKKYNIKIIYRSAIGLKGFYLTQKGNYAQAQVVFAEGIKYQKSLPYTDNYILATFYNSLKDLSVKRNDFKAYYAYDTLFTKYNQLKYKASAESMLQNSEARYESSKKAERIKELVLENELQQKNKLLGYIIAAVLLIGLVFMFRSYYYRQRYYQKREDFLKQEQTNSALKMQLMEKDTMENLSARLSLERRLLRSQMDPHFIFNALGNIQSMILQKDTAPAVSYLNKFAKLTRQVLEQSREETIWLEEEINTLKNYIELQQLRLNNGFDYTIQCDNAIQKDILIPPLLLQPFIENAIEHGIKPMPSTTRGLIEIYFKLDEKQQILICTIKDNGIGLAASKKLKADNAHQSLSTTITDERLSKMQKENPDAGFQIIERDALAEGHGCIVILNIPIL